MLINIDLIPEQLSECGITPGRTKNLAEGSHSSGGSANNVEWAHNPCVTYYVVIMNTEGSSQSVREIDCTR